MKICDLTQFYSPLSGGVKRYVHEKIAFIQESRPDAEHVLVIPGERTECAERSQSRIYSVASPLISRRTRYRALVNLRAIDEILDREKPDVIECGDPYQVAWKALAAGRMIGSPAVAFYHSHFPEAYVRNAGRFLGERATGAVMEAARIYVRNLYNRFAVTLVPSPHLAEILREWGVANVRTVELGVNTRTFCPRPDDAAKTRQSLGIASDTIVLLYVGRLAGEKNTQTLLRAFELLRQRARSPFHLVVIGDGQQRDTLQALRAQTGNVTWISYCADSSELARYYRAADLFVHPGVQETFGLVALESQACGTPVVGIAGSYMDRVILHDQSDWAGENSAPALAEAIARMSARDLSALGLVTATLASERYAWPQVFDRLFCIYEQVCADYKRP